MKSEKVYIELLLLQVKSGDSRAWDKLLNITQVKVKAFACKILGHSNAVDDCVQDTLLSIFKRLHQLKDIKAFHSWIYRIVYSKCMDHIRKYPDNIDPTDEGKQDMSLYEQLLDIKSAIGELPQNQQLIIFLFYYEGFTVAEIAGVMAKPSGTIKYHLFTAREQLKSQLKSTQSTENYHEY